MKVIGHRGAAGLAPENTVAALKAGMRHHVDELEVDIRVTKDEIVVLHHDAEIRDPGGGKLPINAYTYSELKEHKPDLTTLPKAIEAIKHKVPLIIEVKPGEPIKPVMLILEDFLDKGWRTTDFRLASFDKYILMELHNALPDIEIIINERWSGVRASYRARKFGAKRLNMNERWLWSGFIRGMAHRGYRLSAYTLNDPAKAKHWAHFGLWGVITNYPDRFEK
jgi:glycerophosphoryl diester phosphodiesterase